MNVCVNVLVYVCMYECLCVCISVCINVCMSMNSSQSSECCIAKLGVGAQSVGDDRRLFIIFLIW